MERQAVTQGRRKRRFDPSVRDRILDATLELIVELGLRGVTHRRIADAAGVSLSSTTYYFDSLDDLLEQAFERSLEQDVATFRAAVGELWEGENPIRALALIVQRLANDRKAVILASELALAGLRNKRLSRLIQGWNEAWEEALSMHFDDEESQLAVLLATGLFQTSTLVRPPLEIDAIESLLRRGLRGPGAP